MQSKVQFQLVSDHPKQVQLTPVIRFNACHTEDPRDMIASSFVYNFGHTHRLLQWSPRGSSANEGDSYDIIAYRPHERLVVLNLDGISGVPSLPLNVFITKLMQLCAEHNVEIDHNVTEAGGNFTNPVTLTESV